MKQMWYLRGESKFSDHRPVYSLFSVQIDLANENKNNENIYSMPIASNNKSTRTSILKGSANTALAPTCVAKVQAEELLLLTRAQSCIDTHPRF